MSHHRRQAGKACHPGLEALEERIVLAQFGVPWHDPQHLTVSFVPDGTLVGTQPSDLFETLDARQPTADWQRQILGAFQEWTVSADVDFGLKSDGGQPLGTPGPDQEDPRFGDIRIAAVPMSNDVLAISVPHDPFLSGTWSGDIVLNSNAAFGRGVNLLPVLLHEVGHVLGLDESSDPSSVMFPNLDNSKDSLSPGDLAAVQALYGPRAPDLTPGFAGDTLATAAPIATPTGFDGTTPLLTYANIATTSDANFYSFQPPVGYQGPVTVRLQTAGVSLLAPHLTVYDASGTVLGDLSSTSDTGDTLQFVLPRAVSGSTYYVEVQGATKDVFGLGEYALAVNFDARSTISSAQLDTVARQTYSYLSPDDINAIFLNPQGALFHVDHHTNDTLDTAETVQPAGAYGTEAPIRITASLSDPTDVDYYWFETPPAQDSSLQGSSEPLVMTVTVRATEVNGIMPQASVFDDNGNPVPALVLAHGDGTFTIQVANAKNEAGYNVRVSSDPTSGKVVGNYDLDVEFGHVAAGPTTFVASSLDGTGRQDSQELVVNQPQLFDFLLSATASGATSNADLVMTITDASGRVVASRDAGVGETSGGDPVLLTPGRYQASFALAGPALPISFRLYGASLSDPIGPALDDPTFKPVLDPTSGAPSASSPPVIGASSDPYYWLALGLSSPSNQNASIVGPLPSNEVRVALSPAGRAGSGPALGGQTNGPDALVLAGPGGQGSLSTKRDSSPGIASAPSEAGILTGVARVVVTYALVPALLTRSFVMLGPRLGDDRGAQEIEVPEERSAAAEPEVRGTPPATDPTARPVGLPFVPPSTTQVFGPGPRPRGPGLARKTAGSPAEDRVRLEEARVGSDAAPVIAACGIAAILAARTLARPTGGGGGRPDRACWISRVWGSSATRIRVLYR